MEINLKTCLVSQNKTMRQLAKYAGVSEDHISSVAHKRLFPSAKLAKKIEEFCEGAITVAYLRKGAKGRNYICPTCGKRRRCPTTLKQIDMFKAKK